MTDTDRKRIIKALLSFEHKKIAYKLNFISNEIPEIDSVLLNEAIGLIDESSRTNDEHCRKIVIILSAILWSYRKEGWDGLKNFLILVLSRIGYSPSSIMVDEEYDRENGQHSAMDSLINQLSVTIHQLRYEVKIQEQSFLLTRFQKNIWDKIDSNQILGISAPTSAGKSFIIALKAIELLLNQDGTIIYIVPTLSLVSQVSLDFRKLLNKFQIRGYEILNTYNGLYTENRKVFVLTQEKAIGAFSQSNSPFNDVRMLVVDEIQNVERVANENDQRAKTLYDLLIEFRHSTKPDHTVISGPRIEKIGNLGVEVFGEETDEEESKSSPVASITYSITKNDNRYYLKQYTDISEMPLILPIENTAQIAGTGGVQYRQEFHDFLLNVITALGDNSKNIVFSPTTGQARKTAIAIANAFPCANIKNLQSLIDYLSDTVHSQYDLCNTLRKGSAYHHGKLPHHVRRVLEKAISEKMVNNVVCTTTLMQGVNLPAQNIIIRNPNLFVSSRYGTPKLTHYEIANLRGRAGRLLKDFMGRTFVLDGTAFEINSDAQLELFEEATKEIHPGYGDVYRNNEEAIENGLLNEEVPTEENKEYSFLLTYIRQSILRHKEHALERFESVGIELEHYKFMEIQRELNNLAVPIDICLKNRYWDPLDINTLFLNRGEFILPSVPAESGIADTLKTVITLLKNYFPLYYQRYFNIPEGGQGILLSVCINAENWLREKPLKDILNSDYHNNPDNIEKTISMLQNKISYGLPMLLKPIYDIKLSDNPFLRYIELGAYRPVTRRLIEYSIPRETAIYLTDRYLMSLNIESNNFDRELIQILKSNYGDLGYWIRAQLEILL